MTRWAGVLGCLAVLAAAAGVADAKPKRCGGKHHRVCARYHAGHVRASARAFAIRAVPPAAPPAVTPAATPTPTPAPSLPSIPANPFAVQVQAFEYGLQLSKSAVSAGTVRVEFNLARAEDPHNLMLVRADGTGPLYTFDEQPSRAVIAKSFSLTPGRWKLFCSLPDHEANGMRATLTVSV